MKLTDKRIIYSSEKCKITLGEFENKQYIEKTCDSPNDAVREIARIDSPFIAKICEIGDDYIITEYADGFPLSARRISPKEVFRAALELCDALSALHEKNVIYRDVKPSNIIMCNDGHIKLIDFDAARLRKITSDKDTRFIGTDGFAPPEQYGFMQTDERSDIYSFGVTIKLLLAEDYARCPYKRVIEKCIRFNPEQRFSSIKAVKSALKLSRVIPFVFLPICGVAAAGAFIVLLDFGLSAKPVAPENISTTDYASDSLYSETEPSGISPNQSSPNQISSVSSSTTSTQSSVSTSNKSSTASSQSNISASSSSQSSEPISSAASVYSNPTENPIELPIKTNREYDLSWDLLTLPEDCPKLTESVDYYAFGNDFGDGVLRFFLRWEYMSKDEVEMLVSASQEHWGNKLTMTLASDGGELRTWRIDHPEYKIVILEGNAESEPTFFSIYPKSVNYKYPSLNLSLANPTVTDAESRPLKWENSLLPDYIPKLTDYVTQTEISDGTYKIYWQVMNLEETEAVVQKLANSFDEGYKYNVHIRKTKFSWNFNAAINGTPVCISIEHLTQSSPEHGKSPDVVVTVS